MFGLSQGGSPTVQRFLDRGLAWELLCYSGVIGDWFVEIEVKVFQDNLKKC